jgi:NAD(P)-dependent dehydrogenase (short-subunit alcohol dehydrogenase family)
VAGFYHSDEVQRLIRREMMGLDGKVVVIAGGRGGLGQTVTPAFAKAGARVIVIDRQAASKPQADEFGIDADITDETSVTRAMNQALDHAGRLDCLVNLVGGFAAGRLADTTTADWQIPLRPPGTPCCRST